MKKRFYLVMAMIALSWMGCSQEEDAVNQMQMNGGKTINATIESTTRSTVTDAGVFSWAGGDTISLHDASNSDTYIYSGSGNGFTLSGESKVTKATVAYYPASTSHSTSQFYLPNVYGDYETEYVANTHAAMIATPPTEGSTYAFMHLGGVMRFNIKNVPKGTNEFFFAAENEIISGLFDVNEKNGVKTIATKSQEDIYDKVSIKFKALEKAQDMTFYVPMPTGSYGTYLVGINLEADNKGYSHTSTFATNTIKRKTLLLMPTFTFDGEYLIKGTAKVGVIDLEDGDESADISASADIVVTPGDADATATLNYTPANNGTSVLSLSDGSGATESGNSEGKVVVETAAGSTVASCEINTPSLTVELTAPESGAVTFNEVTALTAQQTLVIGEGVTIKKLVLKGGNVILKGNVESIESEVATTITLDKDITLKNACTIISGDITLDLNRYSIKPTYIGYGKSNDAMFTINVGAKLTVQDSSDAKTGVIDTDDGSATNPTQLHCTSAIKLAGNENYTEGNPVSAFVLESGKVMGSIYGIVGNGSRGGTDVVINGGVVDSYHWGAAIFNPQNGNVTINGGEVISTVGVEMRSGILNVTGGTITARVEDALDINGASPSGASFANGVVIGVSQHTTNNPLSINISGGTFNVVNNGYANFDASTYYALYEEDYQDENVDNISMLITGGTFTGKIKSENCEGFIKGGTFHDASLFDYLAPVAEVTLGADITLSDYIEIRDKKIVINLNRCTITHPASSGASYKDVFEVYGTGELTINGEGKVIAEDGYSIYAVGDSKVTINGGYYFSPVTTVDARKNAIVNINGGEFKVDGSENPDGDYGQKFTLNLRDKTGNFATELAEIVVKGGKFYKYDPAASESEPVVTNFVADGYVSTKEGDYYVVTKQN